MTELGDHYNAVFSLRGWSTIGIICNQVIKTNFTWFWIYFENTILATQPGLLPQKQIFFASSLFFLTVNHTYYEETPRTRITVTSSLNEISTDQLGNRVVLRGLGGNWEAVFRTPPPFCTTRLLVRYLKTTWTAFPPSRICFMIPSFHFSCFYPMLWVLVPTLCFSSDEICNKCSFPFSYKKSAIVLCQDF